MNITKPTAINKNDIYQYLGFGSSEPDSSTLSLVETCSKEILSAAQPREFHSYFQMGFLTSGSLYIGSEKFQLPGKDIAAHLAGCHGCVMFAVTLGAQVDRIIRISQVNDMAKAVILDCCASVLIEEICEQISEDIQKEYMAQNLYTTMRFSPGYGDLPLSVQDVFINLLDTNRKIGLTQSKDHLLLPRKSVTAVIGISTAYTKGKLAGCETCALKDTCRLRESGVRCGKEK
ncbi:vitamin B12 dependent-methionine synthase activation domain-containing protein [Clostridium aminobutyricum]|uniref:AdoMet activation domain-containing protein n=1 Tax=Clostridium aminobutyricum TaxID=33953 RepID=A0A939IJC9_CLOAM|nr:vitamin B12 dependent-methionine synthase activation domain-containing protein [Clostridium aminobutyricum]MBN7773444.1 hypothetical protein [Clostridium aminobutyricum]